MTLPTPTIVIFDMDGTTVRHLNPMILGLMEFLDDWAYRFSRLFAIGIDGLTARLPKRESKAKKPRLIVHRVIHKVRRKEIDQIVEPCPGVIDLLKFLNARNIPLGLISNGLGKGYGHDILMKFNLKKYFKITLFREDIGKAKPHPESLISALKKIKPRLAQSDVVWYIGDRPKDVKAALAANNELECQVVPIAYNMHAAMVILEHHMDPDHIIMSFPDMHERLKKALPAKKKAAAKKPPARKKKSA